ncbi:hypothetical protein PHOSAC3_150025 [Mesotoga infera]|nr:hypothetical protein [Thermotogota bacterium]CCU85025.1 hypothetical protein PHOSAC3_150025 [Mesotoga infera]
MAFRIITVPFDNERGVFPDNELNSFLLDKKVNNYCVEFFIHAGRPYWGVFLEIRQRRRLICFRSLIPNGGYVYQQKIVFQFTGTNLNPVMRTAL